MPDAKKSEQQADLEEPLLNTNESGNEEPRNDADTNAGNNAAASSSTEASPPKDPIPTMTQFLSLGRPEFPMICFAIVFMITNQVAQLATPQLVGRAYDILVSTDHEEKDKIRLIGQAMLLVLLVHCVGVVCGFLRASIIGVAGESIVARLRNDVYSSILKQEIGFFDTHKSGELISRLGSDTTVVKQAISSSLAEVALGIIRLLAAISIMFWISPPLAGVTLGAAAIMTIIAVPFGRTIGRLSKAYQDLLGQAQALPTEVMGAMRTVQSFTAEDYERLRYKAKIGDPMAKHTTASSCCGLQFPCTCPRKSENNNNDNDNSTTYSLGCTRSFVSAGFYTFIFGFGFAAMYVSLWYGFILVSRGHLSLGQLTAFQSYIFQIGSLLATVAHNTTSVLEAQGAAARLFALLNRVPKIGNDEPSNNNENQGTQQEHTGTNGTDTDVEAPFVPKAKPTKVKASNGNSFVGSGIHFNNVSFAYPSRPDVTVLEDFDLEIAPNTTTALVGSSGSGKSTVVALLQRFYEASDEGSITINGNDIRSMDLQYLRRHIGYVQQEPQLFGMTIRENVAYGVQAGREQVTDEEILDACRKANAYDFIMDWPDGLDTMVGERGVQLSGGQKQRIAIARAILKRPPILILDEATSALDAESEHLVQQAIDVASEGRTVLVVAHRLSTIQGADQIVVLDNHSIESVGTHNELLRASTTYQNLIQRQSLVR